MNKNVSNDIPLNANRLPDMTQLKKRSKTQHEITATIKNNVNLF